MTDVAETVLVTGASSGIGKALSEMFAEERSRLVLVARSADLLKALADDLRARFGIETLIIVQDLSQPAAADTVFRQIEQAGWHVDVLVNNAGFGAHGEFKDMAIDRQLAMIELNVCALVHLTHLALPGMVARRRGAILNVGSTAAYQPGPYAAIYFATKAFVLSFSEALWSEVRPHNIVVTCLCPGPTRTNFGSDYKMTESQGFQLAGMEARDVALAGHRALRRGRRTVIPGTMNCLLAFLTRFAPRRLLLWAASKFNRS
ncbi:MAG: SDR family oxidoreductase [Planctomycetia bacterium]|nr:SDR family oxidoreductase [Planctomycetia bacterium]